MSKGGLRTVKAIMPAPRPHWVGNGFHVHPVLANMAFTKAPSPFLMFDYAAPEHFPPTTKRLGVGEHPHRGFETVTIAFQGEVEHGDSMGNTGVIGEGDVQWMTAARGIIHNEFHSTDFAKRGGLFEMAQIWINLPAKHKMDPPRYQPIVSADIPTVPLIAVGTEVELHGLSTDEYNGLKGVCGPTTPTGRRVVELPDGKKITVKPLNMQGFVPGGVVRVVAGTHGGVVGPAKTFTPIDLWDIRINSTDASYDLEIPADHNSMVFVRKGSVVVGDDVKNKVGPQGMALLNSSGYVLRLRATEPDTLLLLLSGEVIDEPIAARGPFVMNTDAEIRKANADFQAGILGREHQ